MRDYIDDKLTVRDSGPPDTSLRRPLLMACALCGVALVLLLLDRRGFLEPVRNLAEQAISPSAAPLTGLRDTASDYWDGLLHMHELRAENDALRDEVSQLQSELLTRERVLIENTRLRQQLAIEQQRPWHLIGADVLVRSPDAGRRVMLIGRGHEDGVVPGMAVLGQTGSGPVALVGIVEEVREYTASVLMTTDFGSRVSARVLYDGQTWLGLVQGQWQRGSRLRLEKLERDATIRSGAIVVTAGLTGELTSGLPRSAVPEGVPLGEVRSVVVEGPTQYAELHPYADPDEVRYVWVILGQND